MPDSPIVAAMQRARSQLLARQARRATELVNAYGRIWRDLQADIADLMALLEAGRDRPYVRQRALALARQIEAEVTRYAAFADGQLEAGVQEAIESALRDVPMIVRAGYPVGGDLIVKTLWNRLPAEAVENALGMLSPGSPLRARMTERLGEAVAQAVADRLLEGIALGWSPRKTQDLLRLTFGRGLDWSLTQTRTAHIWAYREATRANYAANPQLVKGWRWMAALDARTCLSCVALNGSLHPVTETLQDHHSGRCSPLPVLASFEELGIPAPEPPEMESGEDWFKRQPESVQREMMGPGMHDAWKEGKFQFRDLTKAYQDDVYGQMLRQASLKDLLAQAA